ncbi:MAG: hypothetical protein ACOYEP_04075 [Limnochordia bacterium]|jgi:hypothetical protein
MERKDVPGAPWTVWGTAELCCWIGHFPYAMPTGNDAAECLEAHLKAGIRHVVWALGRGVVEFHSSSPDVTVRGFNSHDEPLTVQQRAVNRMFREKCQLRAALSYADEHGITLYGRLTMNRHYSPGSIHRSRFATLNPQWCEIRKDGWLDPSRLSYAVPQYREERLNITMEAVRIGCHGIQLDFCRQPPIARYHPTYVNVFEKERGVDPRRLGLEDGELFLEWCRFRAASITQFVRRLKDELNAYELWFDRRVPLQVRVPNDGFVSNLIAGLDVVGWVEEGLVDELALSELQWLAEFNDFSDVPYVELGGKHGIPVFASSNCLPVQQDGWSGQVNPKGVNPLVLARRALQSAKDGAQGIALYQSDTGVRWPDLAPFLPSFHDPDGLARLIEDLEADERYAVTEENARYGIDNHSRPGAFFASKTADPRSGV